MMYSVDSEFKSSLMEQRQKAEVLATLVAIPVDILRRIEQHATIHSRLDHGHDHSVQFSDSFQRS